MKRVIAILIYILVYLPSYTQITGTITDPRDGQVYNIVKIGNQWWMAENLNATKYADGTPLVDGTGAGDISGDLTTTYYFWYDDDSATYSDTYGALYTWAAAMNGEPSSDKIPSCVQGICPYGFRLPSDAEWKEMEMSLGMSQEEVNNEFYRGTNEGGMLKDTALWDSPNTGATNSSGFTALPGGLRHSNSNYWTVGETSSFWSSTESSSDEAWIRRLNLGNSEIGRETRIKSHGYSVRCIRSPMNFINTFPYYESFESISRDWLPVVVIRHGSGGNQQG